MAWSCRNSHGTGANVKNVYFVKKVYVFLGKRYNLLLPVIVIRHGLQRYGETVGNTYDSALVGAEVARILNPVN